MSIPYVHCTTETYGEHRRIEGTVPSVRLKDCNVLVVSLGASEERCKKLAAKLAAALLAIEQELGPA